MNESKKGTSFTLETFIGGFIVIITLFFLFGKPLDIPTFQERIISRSTFDCIREIDRDGDLRNMVSYYPRSGLVSYWRLNRGSGGKAHDFHGENDGTLKNGPTWTQGKYGKALDFDGSNDYVEVPHDSSLNVLSGNHTVLVWIKGDSFPYLNNHVIEKFNQSTNGEGVLAKVSTDNWQVQLFGGGSIIGGDYGSTTIQTDTWYQVGWRVSGLELDLFVNGEIDGGDTLSAHPDDTTYDLDIGYSDHATSSPFNGSIDEVQIYDRALSSGEVKRIYRRHANVSGIEDKISGCVYPQINYDVKVCNRWECNNVSLPGNQSVTTSNYYVCGKGESYFPSQVKVYGWAE